MNSNIFINTNGEEVEKYIAIDLNVKTLIEIIQKIVEKDELAGGYMVRHSKFKGISYNSDDEYADQFISLYLPPKTEKKNDEVVSGTTENNNTERLEDDAKEVAEEDIHEVSFDAKYSIDHVGKILYIYDHGKGNRTSLNAILSILNNLVAENHGYYEYTTKYRDGSRICYINKICVNSAKKSVKFY